MLAISITYNGDEQVVQVNWEKYMRTLQSKMAPDYSFCTKSVSFVVLSKHKTWWCFSPESSKWMIKFCHSEIRLQNTGFGITLTALFFFSPQLCHLSLTHSEPRPILLCDYYRFQLVRCIHPSTYLQLLSAPLIVLFSLICFFALHFLPITLLHGLLLICGLPPSHLLPSFASNFVLMWVEARFYSKWILFLAASFYVQLAQMATCQKS